MIDALAGLHKDLAPYQLSFTTWKQNERKLQQLVEQKAAFDQTESYKQHLLEELAALDLKENELENLEQELKFLENAVTIKSQLDASVQALDSSDNPIVQQIKQIANNLEGISKWQPEFDGLLSRLKAAQIELADIASELERWQDKIDFDENKIITLQERLSAGYSLQKKHKVQSTSELLAIQQQLETDLQAVLNIGEEIAALEKQVIAESLQVKKLATDLSSQRNKQVEPFTKKVNSLLKQVGMPNASIKVVIETIPYTIYGQDKVDILFDANNMNKYEPIRKVASGGELSRLMLCIKSLVAQSMDLPTMIFDEIDTGISGEPAKQVGILLQELGAKRQVLCITHQPQIAAKGHSHLYVYKEQKGSATNTHLKTLSQDERVQHIARMIGGDPPSKTALENAKELLA